jgi:predicted small lipoprotein YifL
MVAMRDGMTILVRCALAALLAGAISACGVRGPLELPPEQKAAETTAKAESGQTKPEGAADKPHQGFILDRLIR